MKGIAPAVGRDEGKRQPVRRIDFLRSLLYVLGVGLTGIRPVSAEPMTCATCRQPITGRYVQFGRKVYHPNHLLCAACGEPLDPRQFMEHQGQPYHPKCYAESFAERCAICHKPIMGRYIKKDGHSYHEECYRNKLAEKCAVCGGGLVGKFFIDPWGNNKTKVVGSFGRFNDGGRLAVPYYLSQSGFGSKLYLGEYFRRSANAQSNGQDNSYSYTPNENTNTVLDGTIAPHSDEFSVGAEREIIADLAANLYFTGKYTRNLYAFDETNFVWDQDGYNVLGTSDGTTTFLQRLRTPNIARRDYFRTDLGMQKNWSDRWQLQGTYSYTISRGSVQNTPSGFLSVPQQADYYVNGLLFTDVRHDVSAGFAWDIPNDPWTTQLRLLVFYESGNPESRYYSNSSEIGYTSILRQTAGTYAREEAYWELRIKVEQKVPVRKGKLSGIVELANMTNNRQGDGAYISSDNRWIISGRQNPLELTLGGRYEF